MTVRVLVSESSRRWARELDDRMERWRVRHELNTLPAGKELASMKPEKLRAVLDKNFITYEMMVELKQEVTVICSDVKSQIAQAKENAKHGIYMPTKDFKTLNNQQSIYGGKMAAIEAQLAKSKRSQKRISVRRHVKENGFGYLFMDAARQELDSDEFDRLLEIAREMYREATT